MARIDIDRQGRGASCQTALGESQICNATFCCSNRCVEEACGKAGGRARASEREKGSEEEVLSPVSRDADRDRDSDSDERQRHLRRHGNEADAPGADWATGCRRGRSCGRSCGVEEGAAGEGRPWTHGEEEEAAARSGRL